MKNLLLLLSLLVSAALAQAADGWVSFLNTATTKISTNSYSGGPATGYMSGPAGSFYFALFVAPTTVTTSTGWDDPNWTFTGNYGTNIAVAAGRFVGGRANDAGVSIPGYAPETQANFLVRGWSADWGTDWSTVQQDLDSGSYGTFYAESLIATDITLAYSAGPLNFIFGQQVNGQIPGFTLNDMVPEPSALALLALGALFLPRRRR